MDGNFMLGAQIWAEQIACGHISDGKIILAA
jgi:hypothetical protein